MSAFGQGDDMTDIKNTPAYSQLVQKRAELQAELQKLLVQYNEKMPIVVDTRLKISEVEREIELLESSAAKIIRDIKRKNDSLKPRTFAIVKVQKANVRFQPNSKSPLNHQVVKHIKLEILGNMEDWLHVLTPRGEGWIHKNLVTVEKAQLPSELEIIDQQIASLTNERKELLIRFTPEYYKVKTVEAKIAELKKQRIYLIRNPINNKKPKALTEKQMLERIIQQNDEIIKLLKSLSYRS